MRLRRQRLPEGTALTDLCARGAPSKSWLAATPTTSTGFAEGGPAREFDTQNLTWWDNIFFQKLRGDATAGLNGTASPWPQLKPDTTYAYFVEITDSNVQSETNICIFQPHPRSPPRRQRDLVGVVNGEPPSAGPDMGEGAGRRGPPPYREAQAGPGGL